MRILFGICFFLFINSSGRAQLEKIDFEKYDPVSTLVVPESKITQSKFPFIDVHNHQSMATQDLTLLIKEMDKMNMAVMVNLSGQGGDRLKQSLKNVKDHNPKRFILFTNINFNGIGEEDWGEKAVYQLEEDIKNGANGLKIFKNLGFSVKDKNGNRVAVDDDRLDPLWKRCGELNVPVLIHTADPKSFWDPVDEKMSDG